MGWLLFGAGSIFAAWKENSKRKASWDERNNIDRIARMSERQIEELPLNPRMEFDKGCSLYEELVRKYIKMASETPFDDYFMSEECKKDHQERLARDPDYLENTTDVYTKSMYPIVRYERYLASRFPHDEKKDVDKTVAAIEDLPDDILKEDAKFVKNKPDLYLLAKYAELTGITYESEDFKNILKVVYGDLFTKEKPPLTTPDKYGNRVTKEFANEWAKKYPKWVVVYEATKKECPWVEKEGYLQRHLYSFFDSLDFPSECEDPNILKSLKKELQLPDDSLMMKIREECIVYGEAARIKEPYAKKKYHAQTFDQKTRKHFTTLQIYVMVYMVKYMREHGGYGVCTVPEYKPTDKRKFEVYSYKKPERKKTSLDEKDDNFVPNLYQRLEARIRKAYKENEIAKEIEAGADPNSIRWKDLLPEVEYR